MYPSSHLSSLNPFNSFNCFLHNSPLMKTPIDLENDDLFSVSVIRCIRSLNKVDPYSLDRTHIRLKTTNHDFRRGCTCPSCPRCYSTSTTVNFQTDRMWHYHSRFLIPTPNNSRRLYLVLVSVLSVSYCYPGNLFLFFSILFFPLSQIPLKDSICSTNVTESNKVGRTHSRSSLDSLWYDILTLKPP